MKKIIPGFLIACVLLACNSKKQEPEPMAVNQPGELCAEQIVSKSVIARNPEWDDEFWAYNVKKIDNKGLAKKITGLVLSGKIKAYEYYNDTVPLSIEKVRSILKIKTDTIFGEDQTGEVTQKIVVTDPLAAVDEIRCKEDWRFDPATASITKKVSTYCLSRGVYDDNGSLKGSSALFWIKNQ